MNITKEVIFNMTIISNDHVVRHEHLDFNEASVTEVDSSDFIELIPKLSRKSEDDIRA